MTDLDSFLSSLKVFHVEGKIYEYLRNGNDIEGLSLDLADGLNYIKFNGAPAFILEKKGEECSYFAYLGS
jgi:hypothetical protein